MILEKSLEKAKLELVGDKLPKNARKQADFIRLVAALRTVAADVEAELTDANSELVEQLRLNLELQKQCHELQAELLRYRVSERINSIEKLTPEDKTHLLGCTA